MIMLIIGHRGAPSIKPENTIKSFQAALDQNVDGLEFDIQITNDSQIVVYHDFNILLNNQKHRILDLDFKTLINAVHDYAIPTLEEVIQICPKNKIINIEIKSKDLLNKKIITNMMHILDKYNHYDNIIVSSFNPFVLMDLKKQAPKLKLGLLWSKRKKQSWFITHYSYYKLLPYSFHANVEFINQKMSNWVRSKGMKLFLYTVNSIEQRQRAYQINADGIFSDYPDILSW